jgi:hypothetical protein
LFVASASDPRVALAFLAGLMLAGGLAMRYLPNVATPRTGFSRVDFDYRRVARRLRH